MILNFEYHCFILFQRLQAQPDVAYLVLLNFDQYLLEVGERTWKESKLLCITLLIQIESFDIESKLFKLFLFHVFETMSYGPYPQDVRTGS